MDYFANIKEAVSSAYVRLMEAMNYSSIGTNELSYANSMGSFSRREVISGRRLDNVVFMGKNGGKLHITPPTIHLGSPFGSVLRDDPNDKRPLIKRIMDRTNWPRKKAQILIRNNQ